MLILSLFPGIGMLDSAFELEGFCVVRGPDLLWGGDIKGFHPQAGKFDGVIGGPPCQVFSRMQRLLEHQRRKGRAYRRAENLIQEFERCVSESCPEWFLMENIPEAPEPSVPGYCTRSVMLNNRWLGEIQNRLRRFSFGTMDGRMLAVEVSCLDAVDKEPSVCASGGSLVPIRIGGGGKPKPRHDISNHGNKTFRYFQQACVLQGLPINFLSDAPFTVEGKIKVVGNGVPLAMGRAVARAVKRAICERQASL